MARVESTHQRSERQFKSITDKLELAQEQCFDSGAVVAIQALSELTEIVRRLEQSWRSK